MTNQQKEKKRRYQKKYAAAHREEISKYMREWRAKHPGYVAHTREYIKRWKQEHRDRIREQSRESYKRHRKEKLVAAAEYREKNRAELNAKAYVRTLKRMYGLTPEQYDAMLAAQGGVCAICGEPSNGKRLAVDHEHATRKVRALLCEMCNHGIGHFRDNPDLLLRAAKYLKEMR